MTTPTPERRAELRDLAERAQPFIRHGGTDPAAAYVPAAELAALLDAADERDRLAGVEDRLSVLLWRLTNACVCDAAALSARPGTVRDMCRHRQEQAR